MHQFQKARIQLTLWYILISFLMLLLFTITAIGAERQAFRKIELALSNPIQRPRLTALLEQRLSEFDANFIERLLLFDLLLLTGAGFLSYLLSGKTLKPIQQMMKKQEEFAADASHELRTPLTTMNIEIEAFKRTEKAILPKYQEIFSSIQDEIAKMKSIVEGLLFVVRAKPQSIVKEKVNLKKIIHEALNELNTLAKHKQIKLSENANEEIHIYTDKQSLKQAILILIDNAIKYTPSGGQVSVTLTKKNSLVQISIKDNGPGIAEKDLPHIFERFYRGETKEKGTGLGLAIAQKIVKDYQGTIDVSSKVGEGSTFTISFHS